MTETAASADSAVPPLYRLTFGHYTQTVWTDVRSLTWPDLAALLTQHDVGSKDGTCVVPATFSGRRRHKADAQAIGVVFLDSDSGATLDEIATAIGQHGWTAVISSSHSHLTTTTRVKRGNWDKFRAGHGGDTADASIFLVESKGYLPRVAAGARLARQDDEYAFFEHQPCPKFRIALPLLRPWIAASYNDQRQANAAWKERIEALAAALQLSHDQSCTDTSRLFYLPRRPADGAPPETLLVDGTACDIFALPAAAKANPQAARPSKRKSHRPQGEADERFEFTDSDTGEIISLTTWAREAGRTFQLVKALQERRPELFIGKVADGSRHHIRCVNEDEHTQAGTDAATFVINAGESTDGGFVYHCRHAHCDGLDRLLFLRKMLEQRWLSPADLDDPAFHTGRQPPRPLIRFVAGDLPKVVNQAEQALLQAQLGLYQRGPFIVRPGWVRVTVAEQQDISAHRILPVEDYALMEAMTQAASWERYDGRADDWVTIDAPLKVASTYRQRAGRWRLPVLSGLINAPTLRPDGSLLASPGYDAATGLLLDLHGVRFPALPPQPTREMAEAALQVLEDLISTFPFVDAASRAVATSTILTACIRRSLPTAPMHAFTAPTAGSGKSMLVDIASLIATGREAGVISQGRTEEELEKRLGALLLAGDQVIAIDNCETQLGGEFLCSMLTQRVVRARILGKSEAPELPANACVTATGNNLVLVGDMTRRALLCRLDPQHERPELRSFSRSPTKMVKADRGRYLIAALTVLRAYDLAGRPAQAEPLGSFEEWSGWVRGALLWLGRADPVSTIEDARALDPKLDVLTAVIAQWQAVIGEAPISVRNMIERATQQHTLLGTSSVPYPRPEFVQPDFREALLAVAGEGGVVNGRRLGKWIAAHQDRIVGQYRITRHGMNAGFMRWQLRSATPRTDAAAA